MEETRDDEWSASEKRIIADLIDESEKLDYPLVECCNRDGGKELMYDLSKLDEDEMRMLFLKLYKFPDVIEQSYLDIHSGNVYGIENFGVLRYRNRNIVVSPDYLNTGGTAIDMLF